MQATMKRERRYLRTVSALVSSRNGSSYRQARVDFPCTFERKTATAKELASVVAAQIQSDYPDILFSTIESVEASIFSHKLLGTLRFIPSCKHRIN